MTTDAAARHRIARQPRPLVGALSSRQFLLLLINVAIFLTLTALRPNAFPSWTNLKAVLSLMSCDLLIGLVRQNRDRCIMVCVWCDKSEFQVRIRP